MRVDVHVGVTDFVAVSVGLSALVAVRAPVAVAVADGNAVPVDVHAGVTDIVAVGVGLGGLVTVNVRVAVAVAGSAVRVDVRVHVAVADLVAVRVDVGGGAVKVAEAVAVRVATRVEVGTGGFVGVRVGVAVLVTREGQNHQGVVAAEVRNGLNVIDSRAAAARGGVKRRFIAISLPKLQRELCAGAASPPKSYAPQCVRQSVQILTRSHVRRRR